MKQFFFGMLVASLLWGGLLYAQKAGMLDLIDFAKTPNTDAEMTFSEAELESDESKDRAKRKKRRSKRRRRRSASSGPMSARQYDTSEATTGDSLGGGSRELGMGAGGEDQLSSREIDQGIDRVFKGIERCLLLMPPDAPSKGKVVFGMHIASSGQVTKVNLKGPKVMVQGETGACLRRVVKTIRYRRFDGPDMVAHYPVVFD
jgi:hypothetical protein